MLNRLKEHGCTESVGEYRHNYQGGQYRITQDGQDVLEDLWLHIDGSKSLVYRFNIDTMNDLFRDHPT